MRKIRTVLAATAATLAAATALTVGLVTANAEPGVCTNPDFVLEDWQEQGMGAYYASGNIWNDNGGITSSMGVCAHDSWYVDVTAADHQDKAVLSYPNIHRDYHDWGTGFEPRIDSFSSITSEFAHQAPTGGIWNVAYDVWINGVGNGPGTTELMIWTENSGQRPAGSLRGTVTVDGRSWELWTTSDNSIVTYRAVETVRLGTMDLQAFTDHLMATGRLADDSTLGQVGYGVEIVQTGGVEKHFDFTNFTVDTSDATPTAGPTTPEPDPTTPTLDPTTPSPDPTEEPRDELLAGKVSILPVRSEPTSVHVDLPAGAFDAPPTVQVTANTSVPGYRVVEVSVKNVTADGFDVVIYRTTAVRTTVYWLAVQE